MKNTYMDVNWEGADYHGFPIPPGQHYDSQEEAAGWSEFELVLAAAKHGDFSGVKRLLTIYDDAGWLLGSACAGLMGEIGNRHFFDELRPIVTSILEPNYSVDLGRSLAMWGHLSVVPTLLDTLAKIAMFDDATGLLEMLSVMLEPEPGELGDFDGLKDIEAYSIKVSRQVDVIASRLGRVDAIVMFGDLFSVDKLVDVIRKRLTDRVLFDPYLRHKFEATTGVDCSGFYENEILQPLQALAILEEFEDRGGAKRYEPGRRYFFGHPVPD